VDVVAGLRMIERLLAVGIGGMSIYLGYRLFLALPAIWDASGEFHLPLDIRVILWRVGPGAFFALFGTAVVALSLYASVRYDVVGPPATLHVDTGSRVETRSFAGLGSRHTTDDRAVAQRADARALLQRFMAINIRSSPDHFDRNISIANSGRDYDSADNQRHRNA
jgi:hypothetical protein